jgi:hypothetical protein
MTDLPVAAAAELLAKTSVGILEQHYPGWMWAVRVDDVGGVMEVRSMRIPGRWGFLLHLAKIDPEGRAIWRAGGELLERYGLKRSAHRPGVTLDIKRDQMQMAVPDV